MSHEISITENSVAEAAYAMVPAWHGLGTVLDYAMNSEEAIQAAHLDWDVVQMPIAAERDDRWRNILIPGMVANVRSDNNRVLGLVSSRYKVIQNRDAFRFVDCLLEDGIVKYESCGALKGGEVVWLLARMPEEWEAAPGDQIEPYILFRTSHGGDSSIHCLPTSVRVVCWNTLTQAMGRAGEGIAVRHKGDIDAKLKDALEVLTGARREQAVYRTQAEYLVMRQVDSEWLNRYSWELIPNKDGGNNTYRQRTRDMVAAAFDAGPQSLPSVRGTAWAAFNAYTQVVDHASIYRGWAGTIAGENRFASILWGGNAKLKRIALSTALTMAG